MATKTKKQVKKPATSKKVKPAVKKPANKEAAVTVKLIAKRVGRNERSTRSAIRRILGGPQVGKGGRYGWKSWNDPEVKKILAGMKSE